MINRNLEGTGLKWSSFDMEWYWNPNTGQHDLHTTLALARIYGPLSRNQVDRNNADIFLKNFTKFPAKGFANDTFWADDRAIKTTIIEWGPQYFNITMKGSVYKNLTKKGDKVEKYTAKNTT
jgi:hypothetical protein